MYSFPIPILYPLLHTITHIISSFSICHYSTSYVIQSNIINPFL
nr:MAG TPA: hypothetical protein [Bacteriophage sp.]